MSALLPYQARWAGDPAAVRVAAKARRIGFTFAEMPRQVLRAGRAKSAGGADCYYIGTSQRLGRKYIDTCARWARALHVAVAGIGEALVASEATDILAQEIRFASGHSIKALPSNPEAIRGEGGSVLLDEAAFHDDLYELLKAIYAVPDWGGDIAVVSTYNGVDNEFHELVEEVKAGRRKASLHEVNIHDALAQGLHRRRCATQRRPYTVEDEVAWLADKLASPGADEEYLCIARHGGGVYLRRDLIEECMIAGEVVRLDLPAEHVHRGEAERASFIARWCGDHLLPLLRRLERGRVVTMGMDFARSGNGDLSVIAPMLERANLQKVAPWLVEMRGVPYEEQWAVLKFCGDYLTASSSALRFAGVTIDSGGSGGWLGEKALAYWGEQLVEPLVLSERWYAGNLPPLRAAFEEHEVLVVKDVEVRDDLLMFQKNRRGVPKLVDARRRDGRDAKPRHGDAAIALALAFSRHARAPVTADFSRRSAERREETRHRRHVL